MTAVLSMGGAHGAASDIVYNSSIGWRGRARTLAVLRDRKADRSSMCACALFLVILGAVAVGVIGGFLVAATIRIRW